MYENKYLIILNKVKTIIKNLFYNTSISLYLFLILLILNTVLNQKKSKTINESNKKVKKNKKLNKSIKLKQKVKKNKFSNKKSIIKQKLNDNNDYNLILLFIIFLLSIALLFLLNLIYPNLFNILGLNKGIEVRNTSSNQFFINEVNQSVKYILNINSIFTNKTKLSLNLSMKNNNHSFKRYDKNIILKVIAHSGQLVDIDKVIPKRRNQKIFYYYPFNKTGQWKIPPMITGHFKINISFYNKTEVINKSIDLLVLPSKINFKIQCPSKINSEEGKTIIFPINIYSKTNNYNSNWIIVNLNKSNFKLTSKGLPKNAEIKNFIFKWKPPYNFIKRGLFSKILLRFFHIHQRLSKSFTITINVTNDDYNTSVIKKIKFNINNTVLAPIINISPLILIKEGQKFNTKWIRKRIYDPNSDYLKVTYIGWHPNHILGYSDIGVHNLTIVATNFIKTTKKTIFIEVIKKDYKPIISTLKNITIFEGETAREKIKYYDPNHEQLKIKFITPIKFEFTNNTFIYHSNKYTFNKISHKINKIKIPVKVVVSNKYKSTNKTFYIIIKRVNYAPIIINHSKQFFMTKKDNVVNLSIKAKDLNNYPLKYIWSINFYNPIIKTNKNWILIQFTSLGEKRVNVKITNGYNSTNFEFIADVYKLINISNINNSLENNEITEKSKQSNKYIQNETNIYSSKIGSKPVNNNSNNTNSNRMVYIINPKSKIIVNLK